MRFVILGAGGVGAVIGGRLFQHGHDVVLIARGAHLEAIHARGLTLQDPDDMVVLAVPAVANPSQLSFTDDDLVVLATKSQDAPAALGDLRDAAPSSTAVACATNGVEAERVALRLFANVYGISVLMPTAYLEPGVVQVVSAPIAGSLDIGRYPGGVDERALTAAGALDVSQFSSEARPDILRLKYRKLVLNTGNSVDAACGRPPKGTPAAVAVAELRRRARDEAEEVFAGAGLDAASDAEEVARRTLMVERPVAGRPRGGGSTWQSLARGGSVETDYLNGEIVLLGRLHGVATPVNEMLQAMMHDLARDRAAPGRVDPAVLLARLR